MPKINSKDFEKELQLFHFTLENLHEAIFWITSQGRIYNVNHMACTLSGYTKEELTSMHVTDINPTQIVSDFPKFWQRLKKEKKIVFEAQHRHKTGYLYDIEITGNFIEYEGQEFSCSNSWFKSNNTGSENEKTWNKKGVDFFDAGFKR